MTRDAAIARAEAWFDAGGFERDLTRLVAIPSESQRPEGLPFCARYLSDEVAPAFAAMGFSTRIDANSVDGAGPILLASRDEGAGLPTVLGYGHGDVVLGQDEAWTKGDGPWRAARDGDRLYGRGTADNKGQHLIGMAAMRAVLAERGRLGFNARFLVETGEETGSPGLWRMVEANRAAVAADVLIASDGPRVRAERPTVCLGARGAATFDLVCDPRLGGRHSGNWGGALADPAIILAHAIAAIAGPTGRIEVPEWRPEPPSPQVRGLLAGIELDPGADGPGADAWWGEPGLTPAENVHAWNSFCVLAMTAGAPDAPVNAIAPFARARCQLRFIAGTDAADILPALRRHLDARGFSAVAITPAGADGFAASRTEPDDPWAVFVRDSLARTAGAAPAVTPQMGGSICNDVFTDLLGIPAIWIPHSYAGCSQHAPDEHVLLPLCRQALGLMTGLYWDIAEGAPARPRARA